MEEDSFIVAAAGMPALNSPLVKRWEACLELDFKRQRERSYLARNLHYGPLVLQKTLHPEGESVCHGVIIHPPGGVAGGDALALNVNVAQNTNTLLTTPGAGKWYKANGQFAQQHLDFTLQAGACLEWLPQENILFDGSQVRFSGNIELAGNAKYAAWDILCFGRQAQHEQWQSGALSQQLNIRRNGRLIWNERLTLKPSSYCLQSIVGLSYYVISGGFVVVAGAVPDLVLEACRAVKPQRPLDLDAKFGVTALPEVCSSDLKFGVTALPEVFSARYVGLSSQCAREYFEQLWQILRPWYASRQAVRPRIWNT